MDFSRKGLVSAAFLYFLSLCCFGEPPTQIKSVGSGKVNGSFRLERSTYCVGEPISVEFLVSNDTAEDFHFNLGTDYNSTLRQRFSFSVKNEAGSDFTRELAGWSDGGIGSHSLKPGEKYKGRLVLNMWTHLMPPGKYGVHCRAILTDNLPAAPLHPNQTERRHSASMIFDQELRFGIVAYDRSQIVKTIRNIRSDPSGTEYEAIWALEVLAQQFQTGTVRSTGDYSYLEKDVLGALPQKWNDMYYDEYELKSNRNWVTGVYGPEKLVLTFSFRNNSNRPRPLTFLDSMLFVNDAKIEKWPYVVRSALKNARIADLIAPGQVVDINVQCNDFLIGGKAVQNIVWKIEGFSKSVQVAIKHLAASH
jgi:hypothetical protein